MANEPSAALFDHVNRSACAGVVADGNKVGAERILRCVYVRECRAYKRTVKAKP